MLSSQQRIASRLPLVDELSGDERDRCSARAPQPKGQCVVFGIQRCIVDIKGLQKWFTSNNLPHDDLVDVLFPVPIPPAADELEANLSFIPCPRDPQTGDLCHARWNGNFHCSRCPSVCLIGLLMTRCEHFGRPYPERRWNLFCPLRRISWNLFLPLRRIY